MYCAMTVSEPITTCYMPDELGAVVRVLPTLLVYA